MIDVLNLATGGTVAYFDGITAEQAVMAAHAQARGDWNTWEYAGRYGPLVERCRPDARGRVVVCCGDWSAIEQT